MSDLVERLRAGEDGYELAAADEIERLTEINNSLMAERAMIIKTKRDQIERLTAELAETKRLSLADRAVISAQKQQLDRLVKGDKSPVAHALQMHVNALTTERDAALAKVAQYEQAPVVGWKIEDWQQIYGIAGYRYLTSKQASVPREHWEGGEYDAFVSAMNAAIPLIARPEVTK